MNSHVAAAGGEPGAQIPMKRHSVARYGLRRASMLDARHDSMRYSQYYAHGFRNPETPGAVRARAGFERKKAVYEKALAEAEAEVASEQLAVFLERDTTFDDINRDLIGSAAGYGG